MDSTSALEGDKDRAVERRPKIICVGTGRDGTLSVYHMIQEIFDRTDGRRAMHEYGSRDFYGAFSEYLETRDQAFADRIWRLVIRCPYDCIVGDGYAAILPYFREHWGPECKLIHIRRADRDACIASLVRNCGMFPAAYGYYAPAEGAFVKRISAFHFGEMTREDWDRLPIASKFGWFYDKTHALIDQHTGLFAESIVVSTESLNEEPTRRAIARLVTGSDTVVPRAVHLHAHTFDVSSLPKDLRDKAMWLVGQVNWEQIVNDESSAVTYFLRKFLEWQDPQAKGKAAPGTQRSRDEVAATLARVRRELTKAMKDIVVLENFNRTRSD